MYNFVCIWRGTRPTEHISSSSQLCDYSFQRLHVWVHHRSFIYGALWVYYIEDIARWHEHMKFIFERKKYFTSERSERVKSFFHVKINFISSSQRVIFFLLHRYECFENKKNGQKAKEKQRNDVSYIFTSEDMENISLVSRM